MKLLFFSSASSISTNRAYIRDLVVNHSVKVHLCVLHRQTDENAQNNIKTKSEPFNITLHKLEGIHPRLESVKGIKNIIKIFRPNHILLEFDPASKLVNEASIFNFPASIDDNTSDCVVLTSACNCVILVNEAINGNPL